MRLMNAIRYGRFQEWLAIKIAWALPRRVALWAMVRVAAHATTGPWGNESPDSIGYKEMHDRWAKPSAQPRSEKMDISVSVQNITPACRENRTSFGAFEEAVSRIREAYVAYHDAPDNAGVTWRLELVRVEP